MSLASTLESLQEVDLQLLRLASTLSKMPQQERIKNIRTARRRVASERTGILGQRKDAQADVADLERRLGTYEAKMEEERTRAEEAALGFREARALEETLTSLAKRVEKCRFELGPARERLAKLELAERNADALATRLAAEEEAQRAALDEGSAQVRGQIVSLTRRREELAGQLDERTLSDYERARVRFKGLAVERLRGNVPSVCRVTLQPSLYHDLMRAGEVAECPYCHRMLLTREASAQ